MICSPMSRCYNASPGLLLLPLPLRNASLTLTLDSEPFTDTPGERNTREIPLPRAERSKRRFAVSRIGGYQARLAFQSECTLGSRTRVSKLVIIDLD
jgi:hypothetical protein